MHPAEIRSLDLDDEMRAAKEAEAVDGAPMLLTLVDLRPDAPAVDPVEPDADGATYADLLEQYRAALVPWAHDADQGALITVLKTIGFTAFAAPAGGVAP